MAHMEGSLVNVLQLDRGFPIREEISEIRQTLQQLLMEARQSAEMNA